MIPKNSNLERAAVAALANELTRLRKVVEALKIDNARLLARVRAPADRPHRPGCACIECDTGEA
jgi:hypothetical protein